MDGYPLGASFEMLGGFWPFGKPDEVFTGTLSSRNGKVKLISAPVYDPGGFSKAFREHVAGRIAPRKPQRVDSITGFARERRCTLLRAAASEASGGVVNFASGQMVSATQYEHGMAVMGLHLESFDANAIESAGFFYKKIHHVLPTPWTSVRAEDRTTFIAPHDPYEMFRFCSVPLKAEVVCEVFADAPERLKKGAKIKAVPRLRIKPDTPQSLRWFLLLADRLENFFTLLLGTSVALNKVQLFHGDDVGWVVNDRVRPRKEKINPPMWVRTESHGVAGALARWLAVPDAKRPVERILLGMARRTSLFVETEFLSLAQALEAFGRIRFDAKLIGPSEFRQGIRQIKEEIGAIWGCSPVAARCSELLNHADEPSFRRRLELSYDILSPAFAIRLLGERSTFARTVVQTRNYWTHPGIKPGKAVIVDTEPMFHLNQRLHALLRCLMLLDLGIGEAQLREPIYHQANRYE